MPQRFLTLFNLLALAVIIFMAVSLFYLITTAHVRGVDIQKNALSQVPDVKERRKFPLDYYTAIIERDIFGSGEEVLQETGGEDVDDLEPTSLNVALLGTVVGAQQYAFAVIEEVNKKKQGLYKVGDSIQGATVKRILRGKVVLRVSNKDEILTMEEEAASRAEPGYQRSPAVEEEATIAVSRSEVDESLKNIHELLTQVRIRPHFRDGKPNGLAVSSIRPGSLFAKLGLRNGDIVQGINGRNIKSPDDVMEVYQKLKSGSRVALQVIRNGEEKIINYQFR
jgi:general secretion pathway protein C